MAKKKAAADGGADSSAQQPSAPPGNGHNSGKTDAEIRAAHDALTKAERVAETARGRLREAWGALKEKGFNIRALKRARAELREDPQDAQRDFAEYLAYRDVLGVVEAAEEARQAEEREADEASGQTAEATA